jgi:pyrroline-5-carboxylate reductase
MGGAMLDGWFKRGLNPVDVMVVEPGGRDAVSPCSKHRALTCLPHASAVPRDFRPDVVVFAVKPQVADDVVPAYKPFAAQHPVFLSVLAGKPTSYFQKHLGADAIVRAMPNTPAAVGKGVSVLFPSPAVTPVQRQVCEVLMSAVGTVEWLADESLMDAVTAVSGSGPAYVFLLAETLRDAGIEAGLPPELAARLARATVAGSGALLEHEAATPPETLRKNVTSPGGTTAAALDVLMGPGGFKELLAKAVAAATRRSKELGG